jgi:hypothetical protein
LLHKSINKKFLLTSGHWRHDDELSFSKVQSWSSKMGRGNVAIMAKQNQLIFLIFKKKLQKKKTTSYLQHETRR